MRRITMWLVATVAVVVLLFSYRTSTMGPAGPASAAEGGTAEGGTAPGIVSGSPGAAADPPGSGAGDTAPPTAPGTPGNTAKAGTDLVVNGTVVQTRWGPVQVQVHIISGRITDVTALQVPNGNRRDIEINSFAVPHLRSEVLTAQSADIDVVSGATVTSEGYLGSLQAALDSAHFKG
ncbi:FMN-binding protein [Planosporangium mesophilum]|uniref:FMN-binding domain-containing protein n=1 Tax=Planosporangium mesophilum TaxID=689768 RepID=A0A8J3TDV7_9ACTN|nr:FMN-binding protein [Planosporangium mesophilum]NJC86142.1 FMN-binding protein [Planosporangium mesophilum]GII23009.1 hypothetical protein Pme01_26060 [Planosporangium mesophilum]